MAVIHNMPNPQFNKIRLNNVIERNVQSFTKPFDLIQALFVLSKYKIKNDIITSNSFIYNVISGIFALLLVFIHFVSLFRPAFTAGLTRFNFVKYLSNSQILAVFILGNLTNLYTNVIHRHNNVLFAFKIQNVCVMHEINGRSLKNFILFNWIYVIAVNGFQVFWICLYCYAFSTIFMVDEVLTYMFYIIFDIHMLFSTRLLKLMSESLIIWMGTVTKSDHVKDSENEYHWERHFRVFMDILDAYESVVKIFRPLILFFCTNTFINGVLAILVRIEIGKLVSDNIFNIAVLSLISLSWVFKNIALISTLSYECERFYSLMTEVRSTCIQLTTLRGCSEYQKRACKNIQRVQDASFKKMDACDLFDIDATLPLSIFGLLTTYIIVVLQFEFL